MLGALGGWCAFHWYFSWTDSMKQSLLLIKFCRISPFLRDSILTYYYTFFPWLMHNFICWFFLIFDFLIFIFLMWCFFLFFLAETFSLSTTFQSCLDVSWVEPVLSTRLIVLLKDKTYCIWWGSDQRPQVSHSSTEPLHTLDFILEYLIYIVTWITLFLFNII